VTKAIILILLSVAIGSFGQLCIKGAMLRFGPVTFGSVAEIISGGWQIIQQPLIRVAIPLYAAGFIIWAAALSHLPLSFAYPLLAMGYLINPRAAMLVYHEQIPPIRWVGIGIIMLGIFLVGRN
jgi:multidrug transporter EmrE-like cation transporter